MLKKEDKLWISLLVVIDVLFWLVLFGLYLGIWLEDLSDNLLSGRLGFLDLCIMILNMAGIQTLLYHEYPDGSPVLPVPAKAVPIIFGALFVVIFVFQRRLEPQIDSSFWVPLLPAMYLSVCFILFLLIGLYKLSKR